MAEHSMARVPDEVEQDTSDAEHRKHMQQLEAERASTAAWAEGIKSIVETPGAAAALKGLGALLEAQAQLQVNAELHQHEQAMLAARNQHEQALQDKKDAEAQRVRDGLQRKREVLLGVAFVLALLAIAVLLGLLVRSDHLNVQSASTAAMFFAVVFQGIVAQSKRK